MDTLLSLYKVEFSDGSIAYAVARDPGAAVELCRHDGLIPEGHDVAGVTIMAENGPDRSGLPPLVVARP